MSDPETLLRDLLAALEAKDIERGLSMLAADAVVIDPHYPQPEMRGRAAIMRGIKWALGALEKPGFKMRRSWTNGETVVAEVETHHVIKGPIRQNFGQVFVVETHNGKITHLRSYPSYGPHGPGAIILSLTRVVWRLRGRLR
jgi:ketosteroid isomerase-like protein